MNLLANENVPRDAICALRNAGHDVLWARETMAGAVDEVVLQQAQDDGRVLLTFDKDFGELAFRAGLPANCGVILVRVAADSPASIASFLVATLDGRDDWFGQFAVVEESRIRMRTLPDDSGA